VIATGTERAAGKDTAGRYVRSVAKGKKVRMDKGFSREVEMKGLTLGAELGPEVVSREICPECPFKTGFCVFIMSLWLEKPDTSGFVCKGMRAWVSRSN
jgi:hypothetical protein